MVDLSIKSNRIITPGKIRNGFVMVNDGKISGIVDELPGNVKYFFDAGNKILMPGIIDPHVHINEPGRADWEGFDTATRSAIAGGITMLVDMPLNSSPVTTSAEAFKLKIESTKQQLHTNCGFWGGIIPGNEENIEELISMGVLGFKAFLTHSGIDEFPNVTESDLRKAMPLIARAGLPLLVHCELSDDLPRATGNIRSYLNYLSSRPPHWETEAIAMMIRLCREMKCKVHIVHLSAAESLPIIAAAKLEGLPVTVESAQHYLYFNAGDIADGQTQFKCAPPIRDKKNNQELWKALKNDLVDMVATDHSPAPPDLKEVRSGNFMKAWGGIASLQLALPVLWTRARENGCSIIDLAKWLCEKPAVLIGKEKSKGKIEVGYDADMVVWDDETSFVATAGMLHHKHKLTPYIGERLSGIVEQTYLAGEKVYDNNSIIKLNLGKIVLAKS